MTHEKREMALSVNNLFGLHIELLSSARTGAEIETLRLKNNYPMSCYF